MTEWCSGGNSNDVGRRHLLVGTVAVALMLAGCSSSPASSPPARHSSSAGRPSSSASASPTPSKPVSWSVATSAAAGGGMTALIAAAKQEGTLNVIGLPPAFANYAAILRAFTKLYGIKISASDPYGTSQQEISAVKRGGPQAPDVVDVEAPL